MNKIFSEEELAQIKLAVQDAEKTTSAEIVPVFYESCGRYLDTYWKSGILFATLWSFLFIVYQNFNSHAWGISYQNLFATQLFAGLLGVVAVYLIPSWKRVLVNRLETKRRIKDVAFRIFLQEGIFNTKERTGMLLFMSFFEKEAVILGDEGINNKVSPEVWEGVLSQLISGMKKKEKTSAIIDTIRSMGNLLKQFPIQANDKNELSDELRLGDAK